MAEMRRRFIEELLNSNKPQCSSNLDSTLVPCIDAPEGSWRSSVSATLAASDRTAETATRQWLALALTPGLGPTRGRRLVEFMGGVNAVFQASLTELEATGVRTVSAQSLGTGRSLELAQDELARAAAANVNVICLDDCLYPSQLKQI